MMCVGGGIIGLVVGFLMGTTNAFAFFATLDALAVLIIYGLVCVGSTLFFRRQRTAQFKFLQHGFMPIFAAILITGIFVLVFTSPGAAPLNIIPFIIAGWVVIGVGVIIALGKELSEPVAM